MGRAGRAERVRAPIRGCNIVLLNGGGGRGVREGREGRGDGGKSGRGAGTYWRL